ncbi:MAG: hypothetical protein AAF358_11530 [Pseudomonadota bacterium]
MRIYALKKPRMLSVAAMLGVFISSVQPSSAERSDANPSWGDSLAAQVSQDWADPKYRAFDFWIGEWEMVWRSRAKGSLLFEQSGEAMHHRVFSVLDGKAIIELAWDPNAERNRASGRGFSIRYFSDDLNRWVMAQNWPQPGNVGMAFTDQLVGVSDHGRQVMYSTVVQEIEGLEPKTLIRRYNFADIRDGAFRWDGSSSEDHGERWSTWAVVRANRKRSLDPFGASGEAWPDVSGRNLCTGRPYDQLDKFEGYWQGTARQANRKPIPASLGVGRILDGCGIALSISRADELNVLKLLSYSKAMGKWVIYSLDDRRGTTHHYEWAAELASETVFLHAPDYAIRDEYVAIPHAKTPNRSLAKKKSSWSASEDLGFRMTEYVFEDSQWQFSTEYEFSPTEE